MRPANYAAHPYTNRTRREVRCTNCDIPMHVGRRYAERQFCPSCVAQSWRVVFDRTHAVGEIPPNLRKQYDL